MDALGVGIIYFPGLEAILKAGEDLIDVVEFEPATIWHTRSDGHFHINQQALQFIAELPFHKLIHGVGFPVGGTIPPDKHSFEPFRKVATKLEPEFVSEHLSFNKVHVAQKVADTGFLLPPLQTVDGVKQAVSNIRLFKQEVKFPFAFETPANYLKPVPGEMNDGEFFAAIAEQSDCGILLDLHNLWCNQINGRQHLMDVIDSLPLERVWEVHIAGGDWLDGYWLDGHSDLIPEQLKEVAADVIPRLTNLKAFNFEIMPEYLQAKQLSVDDILSELELMKEIWLAPKKPYFISHQIPAQSVSCPSFTPAQWEESLMASILGSDERGGNQQFSSDQGVKIYQQLIEKIRAGMFATTLTLTFRYLLLKLGEEETMAIVKKFWRSTTPNLFSSVEAAKLADFLRSQYLGIPYLDDVMKYEIAHHKALIENRSQTITLGFKPDSMFPALGQGRLPANIERGVYQVNITV